MINTPTVLLVDDEASDLLLPDDVSKILIRPDSENFGSDLVAALSECDLILLDHNLALPTELSLKAIDGASFVGHLRSWARQSGVSLPAIAMYTSEDDAYAEEVPAVGVAVPIGGSFLQREHQLSPTLDVEWLFLKNDDGVLGRISDLANACVALRTATKNEKTSSLEVQSFTSPPHGAPWHAIALEHIGRARPPISEPELHQSRDGARGPTSVIRWLLQKALPYPGLFLSDIYASWALGVEPQDLEDLFSRGGTNAWASEVQRSRYTGPANSLFERRWWAAGIDFAAWQLRDRGDALGSAQAALDELAGHGLRVLQSSDKVVVVDADFREIGIADVESAAQLHPPGWPAEAIEPWMQKSDLEIEPLMRAMLAPSDRLPDEA